MTDKQLAGARPVTTSTIEDAEQIRWQRDAAAVLGKLLELAARRGLPVISWTVAHAGARLVGHCYRRPDEARRADFTAWREALGEPDTEREDTDRSGTVHMVAVWDRDGSAAQGARPLLSDRDGYQRASVTLAADITPAGDEYQEAGQ